MNEEYPIIVKTYNLVGATMSHAKTGYKNKGGCDLCNVWHTPMACDMVTPTNAKTSTTPVGATMSHAKMGYSNDKGQNHYNTSTDFDLFDKQHKGR